jgi:2-haloalkanoic acid dehalogenase type II
MRLSDFTTLTFDCYGTLIDWEAGMLAALGPLAARAPRKLSRNEVLATHARHEAYQQATTPARRYSELLAVVYRRIAEEWQIKVDWDECLAYGRSIPNWPAFPDTADALRYLAGHYKLVILSNVDNESFAHSNRKLGVAFDAIYTAEDIGSYKPSPRNFTYLLDKLEGNGTKRSKILHTAESLFHDHGPANEFGLASCWIHRRHGDEGFGATLDPGKMPHYDFHFTSMGAFADAHRKEVGG